MKYNKITLGQIEAVFNKLGDESGIEDFLSGKTEVVKRKFYQFGKDLLNGKGKLVLEKSYKVMLFPILSHAKGEEIIDFLKHHNADFNIDNALELIKSNYSDFFPPEKEVAYVEEFSIVHFETTPFNDENAPGRVPTLMLESDGEFIDDVFYLAYGFSDDYVLLCLSEE